MKTLAELLIEANATAVMIVENIYGQAGDEYVAAKVAIAAAESRPSPLASMKAEEAAMAYLAAAPEIAERELSARIAKRAAKVMLSEAAQRIANGQD